MRPPDDGGLPRASRAQLSERVDWLREKAREAFITKCPGRGAVNAWVAPGNRPNEDAYWVVLMAFCSDHCGMRTNSGCDDSDRHYGLISAGGTTAASTLARLRKKLEILFPKAAA